MAHSLKTNCVREEDQLEGGRSDSVWRSVASDIRSPRFESSCWQNLYRTFIENMKINKKRPRMAHLKNDK